MARVHRLPDTVDLAHVAWWVVIPGLLFLLFLLGFVAPVHEWFATTLYNPGSPTVLRWIFVATIPIHVYEGVWAWRRAKELGMQQSAWKWGLMCFTLGYPGSRNLLKRAKEKADVYEGATPAPKVPGRFLIGNSIEFVSSPLEFVLEASKLGDIVKFQVGPNAWYIINHPDHIYDVTVNRTEIFYKPSIARRLWKPFLQRLADARG